MKSFFSPNLWPSVFESAQGLPRGSHWSTHVEPQLIMWAVASTVMKIWKKLGKKKPPPENAIHEAIGDYQVINSMKNPPTLRNHPRP
jgi:hypothetical protein